MADLNWYDPPPRDSDILLRAYIHDSEIREKVKWHARFYKLMEGICWAMLASVILLLLWKFNCNMYHDFGMLWVKVVIGVTIYLSIPIIYTLYLFLFSNRG